MNQNDEDMYESADRAPTKAQSLQNLVTGPFSSSLANLANSSRAIPSNKDFHFYNNFDEFRLPVRQIADKSRILLESIGSAGTKPVFRQKIEFPADVDADVDEAYDWLVNVNDELLEMFDSSIDEFKRTREEDGGSGLASAVEGGFQVVMGRKKKGVVKGASGSNDSASGGVVGDSVQVKVADNKRGTVGGKPRVSFHIPTIRRPQEEFSILVNNSNQSFEHVWLQRSDDGSRVVHPLEKLSVLDFVEKSTANHQPLPPLPLESTPFKLVEDVKDLKELAAKLRAVNEFAVDLEHNQYRSFQGLTCLMQISTRTEDFVVDTLKLRIHVGPYLREVFKDPAKRKVMHGADRDILWLQRDFGIYVCNLFDTGQWLAGRWSVGSPFFFRRRWLWSIWLRRVPSLTTGPELAQVCHSCIAPEPQASRVLKMERNSLEHLLHHFCGVAAKKEYQNADWRLRPLPDEMLRYAREDTHYLLYIYDLMLALLVSMPKNAESSDPPLVEVFKRSYDVCMQLYEKEIMSESSYLYLYGLQRAGFNAQQLAVASGLFEWRDAIARTEDEGTGYILPNKTLLEIAKEMPLTSSKLRRLLKTKHSYVERHLDSVVSIIRHSMQHAAAFEAAAQQLKEAAEQLKENHREVALQEVEVNDGCEVIARDTSAGLESVGTNSIRGDHVTTGGISSFKEATVQLKKKPLEQGSSVSECLTTENLGSSNLGENGKMNTATSSPSGSLTIALQGGDKNVQTDVSPAIKTSAASVKALKKPMGAFGALLGNAAAKRKFDTDKQVSDNIKLEKIRSQVSLPFHSFSGKKEPPQPVVDEPTATVSEGPHSTSSKSSADPAPGSTFEDIIALDNSSDAEEVKFNNSETTNTNMDQKSAVEGDKDASVSLTDLSASFQKCFQTANQNRNYAQSKKAQEPSGLFQLKPFDYAAAREQVRFGEDAVKESEMGDDQDKKYRLNSTGKVKNSAIDQVERQDETMELRQGRRRQAFPASGNRSITFR